MRKIKIHGIYKHFKGDLYLVEDIGKFQKQEKYVLFIDIFSEYVNGH